jgi:phage gp46-like protein
VTDRLIDLDAVKMAGDLTLDAFGRVDLTDGFETAVTISLFTDARAPADMELPDNTGDRRGWCLAHHQGQEPGSLLWLLSREKQTSAVLAKAKLYAEQALAWLVADKYAAKVQVRTEVIGSGILGLAVEITRRDGSLWIKNFKHHWNAHAG